MFLDTKEFNKELLNFTEPEVEIAKRAGIAQSTWTSVKNGKRKIRPATVSRVAKALNVEPIKLIRPDGNGAA